MPETEYNEENVLLLASQGDRDAFGQLYEQYIERIFNYVYYRTGNLHDAEDLTARVFQRAMNHIHTYTDRGVPFSAWLYRIAHNLVANWHRDRSRRQEIPLNDLPVVPSKEDRPETSLVRSQEQDSLLRMIHQLPPERQNLLILKFVENLSNAEIGQIMGRSEGAVKSLYHRTLLSLRDELGDQNINLDGEEQMLRIVTDGAADMPPAWEKEFDIQVVPINIRFGEKTYLQNVDIDNAGFYRLVDETRTIPKTSQPSPHQFAEFYKEIAEPGDTIISIHVTSKLSGTYASAVQAAEDVKDLFHVLPVDSMVGSVAIGMMCREARRMDRAGKNADEIVKNLEGVRGRVRAIFTLDTLEYAKLSGRVGTMQAALASLMNVKPIAILKDGVLNMAERVRTRKASVARVIEIGEQEFGTSPVYLGILQANDMRSGEALMAEACKHFNVVGQPVLTDLSISVAANLGPGTVGLVLYPVT